MPAPRLAAALVAALVAGPAHASQVHEEDVALSRLLADAGALGTTVVLVRMATPATDKRAYAVPGKGSKRCPPYDYFAWRTRVEQVVFQPPGAVPLAEGQTLVVVPANVPDLVDLERRQCLEGVSKSPIWQRFRGIDPKPGTLAIAVLQRDAAYGWLERVAGAWLAASELGRVRAMLK